MYRHRRSLRRPSTSSYPCSILPLLLVTLLAATTALSACGSPTATDSASVSASPSASPTASPSPSAADGDENAGLFPAASPTASPAATSPTAATSPSVLTSPSTATSPVSPTPDQQLLTEYFAAAGPVYSRFMSRWWYAYHVVDVRAHDTMDQTWPIAARLLKKPVTAMVGIRTDWRLVVPIPADLVEAHSDFAQCIESVHRFYDMARRGYIQGKDMDNDTAYGRTMTKLSKESPRLYKRWKEAVLDQAELLGVPIPWTWKD